MHRDPSAATHPSTGRASARVALVLAIGLAFAGAASADAQYDKERTACAASGSQDRATCLKEAAAAQDERRKGSADSYGSKQRNAEARCKLVAEADKADCMARVDGSKAPNRRVVKSGRVAGGGVLKETTTTTTTTVPASAASATSK